MLAVPDISVLVAGINAKGIAHALGEIVLRFAVARYAEQAEGDVVQLVAGILEDKREVAIDAVPDFAAFGVDADGFGNIELPVLGKLYVGNEGLDDLSSECMNSAAEPEGRDERGDSGKP